MKRIDYRISHERLLQVMHYDEASGRLLWRREGMPIAGSDHGDHRRIMVDGEFIYEHVLVWFYVHGKWPNGLVDHRDVNGRNNRIGNLRELTPSRNSLNRNRPNKNNSTGFLGVHEHGRGYRGLLRIEGRRHSTGVKDTAAEAYSSYLQLRRIYCPEVSTNV